MQLILAIDSDPRRSEQLAALVRAAKLRVDLVQATSAGEGLHALKDRVPDLILTAPLLSPFDDGVLDEYLRDLGSAATHVQTVRIPMLSAMPKKKSGAKSLFGLGRKKPQTSSAAPDGCDPKIFADEIAHYLTRSAEQQAASKQTPAETRMEAAVPAAPNDPLRPEALIEEFTEPVYEPAYVPVYEPDPVHAPVYESEPVYVPVYAPEPAYEVQAVEDVQPVEAIASVTAAPVVVEERVDETVEERYVPGTILGLRPERKVVVARPEPIVKPEPQLIVKPEPQLIVEPEPQTIVRPDPAIVEARPVVEPEPMVVEPAAASQPAAVATPAAPTTGTSPSFEAALAAIRAAWVKPEDRKDAPAPPGGQTDGRPTPLGAGSAEVDLTNEIDALGNVDGVDGQTPATDDEPSPDESKTPAPRHKADATKKRPEKGRGRKTRGPDGRDDWGVFDPNQYGFSALVNKLDEVTDDDVVTTRGTTIVR